MIKRIFTAIVVLPVSFGVLWLVTLVLISVIGGLLTITPAKIVKLTGSHDILEELDEFEQTSSLAIETYYHIHTPYMQDVAAVIAAVGALIFSVSCLSERLYGALLICRRLITLPLVIGYSMIIFGILFYVMADYICVAIVGTSSAPQDKVKNVADFHLQYDDMLHLGVLIATGLATLYVAYRLIRWDGLPWCRTPRPVQLPHRSRRAL